MQPDNPIVGSTVLRRPAIQSPDYVAGVSGWIIRVDGSVEFNDGTFRGTITAGTFEGTEFVIDPTGAYFYDSAPALNHLTFSIATQDGVDPFGNVVFAGFTAYDVAFHTGPVGYINMIQQTVFIGGVDGSGVFQSKNDAGGMGANGHHMFAFSPREPLDPTISQRADWDLRSGKAAQVTGSADAPRALLYDSLNSSAVDLWCSGSAIKTDLTGTPYTWQVPTPPANWTFGGFANELGLQYRFDTEDNLIIVGAAQYTGAATLAAGTVTNLFTLPNSPVNYRPKKGGRRPAYQSTGNGVFAWVVYQNTGGVMIANPTAAPQNTVFEFEIRAPQGNVP